jgi:uncharacterized protein
MTQSEVQAEDGDASAPFRQWIAFARPKAQLWRTAVGGVAVVLIWLAWTAVLLLIAIGGGVLERDGILSLIGEGAGPVSYPDRIVVSVIMLGTFAGLWLGVWLVAKFLHKRTLASVISFTGRFNWRQFGVGLVIGAAYLLIGLMTSVATGHSPFRTDVELGPWLLGFIPVALLLLIQTSGEELFFRGYLVQQLAARFRHPVVWVLVPALAFGAGHYSNGGSDLAYSVYYVAATVLFALISTACLWRTGNLSVSMGLHFINNVAAFLLAGPQGLGPSTSLWAWTGADMVDGAGYDLVALVAMLAFVLSRWAPLPKVQLSARRNETRAAP